MDIGSIFLILALLVVVGLFVSRPFFSARPRSRNLMSDPEEHEVSTLMAERDRVINALQELEFDYALGKIPVEDYPAQRQALMQHGAQVLRDLDEHQVGGGAEDADARLEAAIAARRADSPHAAVMNGHRVGVPARIASPDEDLEVMLANRRRQRQDKPAGFCPQCGGPVQKSDQFCPKCGTKLT